MIDILMATYNGGKYLREQLDSIINQTYSDWHLIIADDCSNDNTVKILEEYRSKYPKKITYYVNDKPTGGAKHNFYQLMLHANSDYIMFSDQDDVWLANKIETTYLTMLDAEQKYGSSIPLLVHSDLCVVNQKLEIINESIFAMQSMDYRKDKLNNLLVSNIVTGCTMMINKSLLNMARIKPQNFVMHDIWLALIASAFGKIFFIQEPLILYRQHGDNSVGAKDVHDFRYFMSKLFGYDEVHKALIAQYAQAGEFLKIFDSKLTYSEKIYLKGYSELDTYDCFRRYLFLKKNRMFKIAIAKKIGQLIL